MQTCPICKYPHCESKLDSDVFKVTCLRCGHFEITRTAAESLVMKKLGPRGLANISGFVHANKGIAISASNIYSLLEIKAPSFRERAERLLLALEKSNANPGVQIVLDLESNPDWLSKAWACDDKEVAELLDYLAELGLIRKKDNMRGPFHVAITPQGFVHLDQYRAIAPMSSQGYVILSSGETLRQVYHEAMAPAITEAGFEPFRLPEASAGPAISDESLAALRRSRFVVADLSGQALAAYYLAGLAKGLGLFVIFSLNEEEAANPALDLGQYGVILWNKKNLESFKTRLQNRIEAEIG